ncbi:MAG: hypothetical protein Crog4KO_29190 [Crocinitomicaceae bacterium]
MQRSIEILNKEISVLKIQEQAQIKRCGGKQVPFSMRGGVMHQLNNEEIRKTGN